MTASSLNFVAVGLGIQTPGHVTAETEYFIRTSDKVLYLVADQFASHWLLQANSNSESLRRFYQIGQDRLLAYEAMIQYVVETCNRHDLVCFATYGHPGVFSYPIHESIRRLRSNGRSAIMVPSISAEDCLFADLGVDPGASGCSSFEATDFLLYERIFDPTSALILWQVGVLGELRYQSEYEPKGLDVLQEKLLSIYPEDHNIILYEASTHPVINPRIIECTIEGLTIKNVKPIATLYVPPLFSKSINKDVAFQLGIELHESI